MDARCSNGSRTRTCSSSRSTASASGFATTRCSANSCGSRLRLSRGPEEIAELHRRAGAWLAGERHVDAALDHLLAAGDVAGACELVIRETGPSVDEERWHDLERWVRLLPREAVEAEPELLVAEAWKFQLRHAWDDLARNLDLAEALLEKRPSSPERILLQSEIWALRARWLYWQGDGPGTLDARPAGDGPLSARPSPGSGPRPDPRGGWSPTPGRHRGCTAVLPARAERSRRRCVAPSRHSWVSDWWSSSPETLPRSRDLADAIDGPGPSRLG